MSHHFLFRYFSSQDLGQNMWMKIRINGKMTKLPQAQGANSRLNKSVAVSRGIKSIGSQGLKLIGFA